MKKFGTPIAAGPGSENEYVGLAAVGTPPLVEVASGLLAELGSLLLVVLELLVEVLPPPGWEEGFSGLPGPVVRGARELVLLRLVELVEVDRERELALDREVLLEVVVEELELEVGEAVHVSLSDAIPTLTGREIEDSGVPGGTLTVKESLWPVIVVTVTTHVSASATGIAASPKMVSVAHTIAKTTTSFRLFNTVT